MTGLCQQFSSQPIYAAEDDDWGITTEECIKEDCLLTAAKQGIN